MASSNSLILACQSYYYYSLLFSWSVNLLISFSIPSKSPWLFFWSSTVFYKAAISSNLAWYFLSLLSISELNRATLVWNSLNCYSNFIKRLFSVVSSSIYSFSWLLISIYSLVSADCWCNCSSRLAMECSTSSLAWVA